MTDIAGSTEQAVRIGDQAWREIIEAHDVEWVRLRAASVRHDAILSESALVGRVRLLAGLPEAVLARAYASGCG
jgi:hypothetical protein